MKKVVQDLTSGGHEWMRAKWSAPIRKYWKISEQMMVKYCDLAICDSVNAYFHGHTVGGTNPSLIEALGSTDLNLLVDVGFNKEVAEDCALYWSRKPGSLAKLIDKADRMSADEIAEMGRRAKKRVAEEYTWDKICGQYENVFVGKINNG